MTTLRTIDPTLPPLDDGAVLHCPVSPIDLDSLPLPCEPVPLSATGLRDCALHQIRALMAKSTLTAEEEDALDDGFVLCDLSVVRRKLEAWRILFPRIKPFFALKCNPDVMAAAVLGQCTTEVGFDCASISEIDLALRSTLRNDGRRLVYANPQRAETDLDAALSKGVEALTFDGAEELRKVSRAHERRRQAWECRRAERNGNAPQCCGAASADDCANDDRCPPEPPEMILRILVPDETSSVPLGEKFGVAPSSVEMLATEALDLGLPVVGVSFHCGSGCHDPDAYGAAIRLARDAMDAIDRCIRCHANPPAGLERCTLLDIGGGYPGLDGAGGDAGRFCMNEDDAGSVESGGSIERSESAPLVDDDETASKIAAVVTPLVDELFPVSESPVDIISEPGRYFVEAAFALCSRIYSTKVEALNGSGDGRAGSRRHYYIAQGVQGLFKDVLLCGENFVPIPLMINGTSINAGCNGGDTDESRPAGEEIAFLSTVHGPSGEDYDVVCADCMLPPLSVGDWLIFDRMGAYTLSIASRSGSLPIRYVVGGHGCTDGKQ